MDQNKKLYLGHASIGMHLAVMLAEDSFLHGLRLVDIRDQSPSTKVQVRHDPFAPEPIMIKNPYKDLPQINLISSAKPDKRKPNFTPKKKKRKK
jgi:hypothetical protein